MNENVESINGGLYVSKEENIMRKVSENEYSVIRIYQTGSALDSTKRQERIQIPLDREEENEKPDFSKMFHMAIANIV